MQLSLHPNLFLRILYWRHWFSMGEAPAFCFDNLQNGFGLKPKGLETSADVGDKTFVIGGADNDSTSYIGVKIYDKSTGKWVIPTVLGTKPKACKGHSAILLNEDRIMIIIRGSTPDDCIWFLEADTKYVKEQRKFWGFDLKVALGEPNCEMERLSMQNRQRCILDIDVQGARSVRASSLDAIFIFICPPTMRELEERLRARGTETEEQILKRLRNAEAEIEQGKSSGIFGHILYNDNLEECYENLKELLGLNGSAPTNHKPSPKGIDLPSNHSVSKIDNKILINCETPELEKASKNLIALDVSSLKGGAPGRTRGLNVYALDSFSDGLNEKLS
ncbi:hypothetical protein GOBAR_DD34426 [Gossypium barbadense]|nr:hypothetical protein GOBAR_DD34426 [Gossypium barbadense]